MSERRRAGRAKAAAKPKKAAKAPRRISRTSALGRRMADAMRNRGVGGSLPRRPRGENPERGDTPSKNPRLPKGRKKLPIQVGELPPGPTRGQGDPRKDPNRPKPQTKPDLGEMEKVLKKVGKPVPPPGGKPPMRKPMPVMPGPVVGKPVPAPPPGSNPPMPGIKPKPPGGFRKGGTVGGAKKKSKAKIRGAGIERKGLRKAKMY